MPEVRTLTCDKLNCEASVTEQNFGDGFIGWGSVGGRNKNGNEILLCPKCLIDVLEFIHPEEAAK